MNRYSQARKYINIEEVKRLHEEKIAKQIALAEKQYLSYFAENVVPKYYDWETGQFNENPLIEIKSTVLKRLEEIESALSEGMKMKDFNYLYGGEIGSIITSINPNLVSSTFAHDLIKAGGEVTSTMFGPDFPGSHINSIGDFDKPESLSKVDAQAHQGNRDTTSNNAFPHTEEGHKFPYQADGYTLPTSAEMNTTRDSVQEAGYYDNQLMQMIWPNYGQVITDPNSGTDHPWDDFPIPTNQYFTNEKSYDMNNLTQTQLDDVKHTRLSYPAGRFGGVSGTYHDDNHFLDITYGQARSIDEKTFDLGAGLDNSLDTQDKEHGQLGDGSYINYKQWNYGPGWAYVYDSDLDDSEDSIDKEHWQYIDYSDFYVSHFEDIVGVRFPPALIEKYKNSDGTIYTEYQQVGGDASFDRDDPDFPLGPQNTSGSRAFYSMSANKKVIENAQVGQKISFDYRLVTDQYWDDYNTGYPLGSNQIGDGGNFFDYVYAPVQIYTIAGKSLTKVYDMHRELPDDEVTSEYGIEMLNGLDATGSGEYVVRQEDIDPVTGALDFYVALIADQGPWTILNITNFNIDRAKTSTERAAGSVADTTSAYDLGAPVAALASNKGKGKKKKDEEEEDEIDSAQDSDTETGEEDPTQDSEDSDTETGEEDPTQDSEDPNVVIINGKPRDKEAYSVLGAWTPTLDQVANFPTYSDIEGQTEPPKPGEKYYTSYYGSYVPKQGPEYESWLSSIPAEQAEKISSFQSSSKVDTRANQQYVNANYPFSLFGKAKLYGKYGDRTYYNPADTGQKVPGQVKITWDDQGAPWRRNRFGTTLADPGQRQDSYGFPLYDDWEESDFTYWKGKRYWKGSYDDTMIYDPETFTLKGSNTWWAEKDSASAKTGNSDTMSTTNNFLGPRAAWENDEFVGMGPNEQFEFVLQYNKQRDKLRPQYGRLSAIPKKYHRNNNYLQSLGNMVIDTMPKGWARPFVPADGEGGKGDEKEGYNLGDLGSTIESIDPKSSKKLQGKYGEGIFRELGQIYQRLNTLKDAGSAFLNFLLQQQGLTKYTKNNPYIVEIPEGDKRIIAQILSELFETKIPKERWNNLSQADLDLINETLNPKTGPTPTNPYREGTNEDEYHNIFNNLGDKKGIKVKVDENGKPHVTEINDNYVFENDADASVMGAPALIKFFSTSGGAQDREDAAGGGEYTYRAGGVFSGNVDDIKPPTDLKMKNMPIRMKFPPAKSTPVSEELYPGKLFKIVNESVNHTSSAKRFERRMNRETALKYKYPARMEKKQKVALRHQKRKEMQKWSPKTEPNSNELYPGQPSPNGFPDTPPPELAPNGYHPEFGKQAKRYTKLDPISAKTMNQVGTDDPETNKQVAAAAAPASPKTKKKVHAGVKKYAKRNVVKKESNNLYMRSRKHIDLENLRDLNEKKVVERKIFEKQMKQIEETAKHLKSNWRKDI